MCSHDPVYDAAECREDLKRDEEIFGEKVLELKQTRRAVCSVLGN